MVTNLEDIAEKIKSIKEEVDKIEFRVLNTRSHIETIEKSLEKLSKEILEGFHIVSTKVNNLEKEVNTIEKNLEKLIEKK